MFQDTVVDDEDNLVMRCHTTTKQIPDETSGNEVRLIIKPWLDEAMEQNLYDGPFDIINDGWVHEESDDYWPNY